MRQDMPLIMACFFSFLLQGQVRHVSTTIPFEGIGYEQKGDEVVVTITLKEIAAGPTACPVQLFKVEEFSVATDKSRTDFVEPKPYNPTDPLGRRFAIRIGHGQLLLPDWQWFRFAFATRCELPATARTVSPEFRILRRVADSSETDLVLGQPQWYLNSGLYIPVKAKEDVRIHLLLKEQPQGVDIAEAHSLLHKNETTDVELLVKAGRQLTSGTQYKFQASAFLGDAPFATAEQLWNSGSPIEPYALDPDPTDDKLRATRGDKPFDLTVETTESGNLTLVFEKPFRKDTRPSEIVGRPGTGSRRHHFQVNLSGVEDGLWPFHFSGKSDTGRKFVDSDKKFVLVKDTATRLTAPITFRINEADILTISYSLSREIKNAVHLVKYNLLFTATALNKAEGSVGHPYKVEIDLNAASNLRPFEEAVKPTARTRAPVDMRVVSLADDRPFQEQILSFQLEAVRLDQETLQAKLLAAKEKLERDKDEIGAKADIKKALGIKSEPGKENDAEKKAIDFVLSILKGKDSDKKTKFFAIIKFAAKVAASYFGVPVT